MKGIILAGGSGSRLWPVTRAVSKQLLPVYDKPMIYYPLSTLMLGGIREILIITTPTDAAAFRALLGDGSHWGVRIDYAVQPSPDGLAQAFVIGREFVGSDAVTLVLGDNIFFGHGLTELILSAVGRARERSGQQSEGQSGATVFGYQVRDPQRFGVVSFGHDGRAVTIEEKPEQPQSDWAVTGLYVYDNEVLDIAAGIRPSARGELEITDVNAAYLARGNLFVERLGRGFTWFDTGTHDSLAKATSFVQITEEVQQRRIGVPEEIAFSQGWIDAEQLMALGNALKKNGYGQYLMRIARGD
ncbi:MAG: glucose-1-phosphate thymidylyltransferase RfbA [Pseudomonadota bacterium]